MNIYIYIYIYTHRYIVCEMRRAPKHVSITSRRSRAARADAEKQLGRILSVCSGARVRSLDVGVLVQEQVLGLEVPVHLNPPLISPARRGSGEGLLCLWLEISSVPTAGPLLCILPHTKDVAHAGNSCQSPPSDGNKATLGSAPRRGGGAARCRQRFGAGSGRPRAPRCAWRFLSAASAVLLFPRMFSSTNQT